MTARWDFTGEGQGPALVEGTTFTFTFQVRTGDPDGPVDDYGIVDLTGYTAAMTIREAGPVGGGRQILELTTANGRLAIDEQDGEVTATVAAADTAGLGFETGVYAFDLISAGGVRTRELEGAVAYRRAVIR